MSVQPSAMGAAPPAPEDDGLALVARDLDLDDRYRIWRGRSGRRYLVTVVPLSEALKAEGAVVLIVAFLPDGSRRVVWAGESGVPAPALKVAPEVRIEAHVHLLAQDDERRAQAIADLVDGGQHYSSVLTVSAAASQDSAGSDTPSLSSSLAVFST
ncbi:hypothetical protein IHQ68_06745 [Chelatococcus sambhunathii]|uniref:Uncharacterized protein n=1 Tax=Chelatococcus sambhunathii TaxID=363953 RepID=A0ABU1DDX5_9HYPH|nr:hypothetical protein [Chelatococcus sambhunathii]MDR4306314.1 hypothetical protein [Chelatococcus sambhunathii]